LLVAVVLLLALLLVNLLMECNEDYGCVRTPDGSRACPPSYARLRLIMFACSVVLGVTAVVLTIYVRAISLSAVTMADGPLFAVLVLAFGELVEALVVRALAHCTSRCALPGRLTHCMCCGYAVAVVFGVSGA
jgi:hypothetical protein